LWCDFQGREGALDQQSVSQVGTVDQASFNVDGSPRNREANHLPSAGFKGLNDRTRETTETGVGFFSHESADPSALAGTLFMPHQKRQKFGGMKGTGGGKRKAW